MTRAEIEARARAPYARRLREMLRQQDVCLAALLKCREALRPCLSTNDPAALDAFGATTAALLALDRTPKERLHV